MLPEAVAGGLHTTPALKERAGTRVAGQECPTSAQGAPGASSCSLPRALHYLHPKSPSGKSPAFPRGHRPTPGDGPWAGTQFPALPAALGAAPVCPSSTSISDGVTTSSLKAKQKHL